MPHVYQTVKNTNLDKARDEKTIISGHIFQ